MIRREEGNCRPGHALQTTTPAGSKQWRQQSGNYAEWVDAKGKVSWGTEVTQWGPGAKTQ